MFSADQMRDESVVNSHLKYFISLINQRIKDTVLTGQFSISVDIEALRDYLRICHKDHDKLKEKDVNLIKSFYKQHGFSIINEKENEFNISWMYES